MPILVNEETNVKLFKERRNEIERLQPKTRPALQPANDRDDKWSAVCQEDGCGWRRDNLSGLDSATTSAYGHSIVTRREGAPHRVLPEGLVKMRGMIVVADEVAE